MKTRFLYVSLFAILLVACEKSEWMTDGDYFFLENKEAVMPVWVKGNRNSDVFIITVHGGPGGTSGHEFPISKGFKLLEEKYNIVYWDQRMSGMAQGDPDPSTLTIDQHIEDLEKLVELIRYKYNPSSLFLLGHSWGGVMCSGYLGSGDHQDFFNGWIDLDGSIQEAIEVKEMKKWILEKVPLYYDYDPEFYQYIIDWYAENPTPKSSAGQPYWYASSLGGYVYDYEASLAKSPVPYAELAFRSPYAWSFYWTRYTDISWVDGYDMIDEVNKIEIPALLLWGADDGVVTKEVGQYAYNILGTDLPHKHLILLDSCAHSPHYDQPEKFFTEVVQFVEMYK